MPKFETQRRTHQQRLILALAYGAGAAGDGHVGGGGHVGVVGRALPGVRVRVDGAGGGSEGEVVVGGEQVARC